MNEGRRTQANYPRTTEGSGLQPRTAERVYTMASSAVLPDGPGDLPPEHGLLQHRSGTASKAVDLNYVN